MGRYRAFSHIQLLAAFCVMGLTVQAAGADKSHVLYVFDHPDGSPQAGLIFDAEGNLYGTTYYGGADDVGSVFELLPRQDGGGWEEKALYSFNGPDGCGPSGPLILGPDGSLYGTTVAGGYGYYDACLPNEYAGNGFAFRLTPQRNGKWIRSTVHRFGSGHDGANPYSGLVSDPAGNLYGTTYAGGLYQYGTIFELVPGQNGSWTEKVLHSFNNTDGAFPLAGLFLDAQGDLYGATFSGGNACNEGGGVVFELQREPANKWSEAVLHRFNCTDGADTWGGVIPDPKGDLFGTTFSGGASSLSCQNESCGVVFKLSIANGKWEEQVLHEFQPNGEDCVNPAASLTLDSSGNLYGTCFLGGAHNAGGVFELSPQADRHWKETVVYSFDGTFGANPVGGLTPDAEGNLYGTTTAGSCGDCGDVFEITP
jgi:uncharacterized repeat protein (TIGR03803 family)